MASVTVAAGAELDFNAPTVLEDREIAYAAVDAAGKQRDLNTLIRAMASRDADVRAQSYLQARKNFSMEELWPFWRAILLSEPVWKGSPRRMDVVQGHFLELLYDHLPELLGEPMVLPGDGELTPVYRGRVVLQIDRHLGKATEAHVDFRKAASIEELGAAFEAVVAAGTRRDLETLVRAMGSPDADVCLQAYMQAMANIPMDQMFPLWRAVLLSDTVWKVNPGRADVVRDQMLLVVRRLLPEVYWLPARVPAEGELTAADRTKVVEQIDGYLQGTAGKPAPDGSGLKVQNDHGGAPFLWVRRGKLYYLDPNLPYNGVRRKAPTYVYRDNEGVMSVVSFDLGNIQAMVRRELDGRAAVEALLKNEFSTVLMSTLAQSGDGLIDAWCIKSRAELPQDYWGKAYSPKKIRSSAKILTKYVDKGVSVKGDEWEWVLYVLSDAGSIDQWSLHGKTWPFTIDRQEKKMVEKAGTIVMPEISF